jgi:hypothetical protein
MATKKTVTRHSARKPVEDITARNSAPAAPEARTDSTDQAVRSARR